MKKVLQFISEVWKYLAAIVGIGAAALWFDGRFDTVDDVQQEMVTLKNQQGYMMGEITSIKNKVIRQGDTLEKIIDHQKDQDKYMNDMKDAARFYIKNQEEMTEEAMKEAVEMILKKNEPIVSIDTE